MPSRRAGSPVHVSPEPRMANSTPAACSSSAKARVTFFDAVLQRAGAADPEQVLDVVRDRLARLDPADLEVQRLRPLLAGPLGQPPRVALVLDVAQHHAGLGRERRLDQHLVAAHVHDVVDVLDVDRALLDAGAAGRAGPEHVRVDDAALLGGADQRPLGLRRARGGQPPEAGLRHAAVRRARLGRLRPALVDAGRRDAGAPSPSPRQQVGRLGEQVVAQVHDHELRATAACRCSTPGTATGTARTRCRWRSRACPSR